MGRKKKVHDVVVVGGGVSGLAAAHRVIELAPDADVVLLEASERVGGLIRTELTEDGYVIERGAESIITDKPWAIDLIRRVGLGDDLVSTRPEHRGAYVVAHGKLERIPEGFSLLAPVKIGPFMRSPILSLGGKLRAGLDLVLPRWRGGEESLERFVSRRFGPELLDRLAQPMVSGIYGASADRLSLEATMPRFVEMEREHRSVSLALFRRQRAASGERATGARYGLFVSLREGNEALPRRLAERLGDRVRTEVTVEKLERDGDAFRLKTEGTGTVKARTVILALAARAAAPFVGPLGDDLVAHLRAIPYGSAATVTFAFDAADVVHPLDAYGFVVPVIEQRAVLASTWLSRKWPGRAPQGKELIRVFLGGSGRPEAVGWDDDELIAAAYRELDQLIGLRGNPELTRVDRYLEKMPHYHVGHARLVDRIFAEVEKHPGLFLAGNAYRGVGIPDSVRMGEAAGDAAARLLGAA